jgi:hypothetical protein
MAKQGKELGDRSKERSKTFPGIANAMAIQWAGEAEIYNVQPPNDMQCGVRKNNI